MSTLRLTTISNQTGSSSVPSETVINGSAKAWVNFNGTGTVAIRASFNVSSITDNGTGSYTVNLTTAMVDGNYSVVALGSPSGTWVATCSPVLGNRAAVTVPAPSVSSFSISYVNQAAGSAFDVEYAFATIFR